MTEQPSAEAARQVRPYDFRRNETLDRSRIRQLTPILDVAAHRIANALAGLVRSAVKVDIGELDQQRWEEFAGRLPDPTLLVSASVLPLGGKVALHVPLPLAFAILELRLGGEPTGVVPDRALTDLELRLAGEAADATLAETASALSLVTPMSVGATTSTTSAAFLQVASPSEVCLLATFNTELPKKTRFPLTLCLPLAVMLPLLDSLEKLEATDEVGEQHSAVEEVRNRLLDAPLEVRVSFPAVTLASEELVNLTVDDVIPLHRPEGSALRLVAGGVQFCEVVPTSQGKRLACMVVESESQERR